MTETFDKVTQLVTGIPAQATTPPAPTGDSIPVVDAILPRQVTSGIGTITVDDGAGTVMMSQTTLRLIAGNSAIAIGAAGVFMALVGYYYGRSRPLPKKKRG